MMESVLLTAIMGGTAALWTALDLHFNGHVLAFVAARSAKSARNSVSQRRAGFTIEMFLVSLACHSMGREFSITHNMH